MLLWQIILAVLMVSLVSLVGVVTVGLRFDIKTTTFYLISLASGTMLGGAFIHLIPEAMEQHTPHVFPVVSGGVFLFFVLEKFLIWRHCHHHNEPHHFARPQSAAKMVLIGDGVHNFIDGVIIASAFLANQSIGFSVAVAIMLHEIPQELGDFGVLVHGGYPVKRALLFNFLTSLVAMAGALGTYFFFSTTKIVHLYALPFAAGGFLYIALADLIPQLHERVTLRQTVEQILLLGFGFLIMVFLRHR